MLKNKIILVVGSAGSICSALSRKLAEKKPKLLCLLDNNETGLFDIYEELKDKCKVEFILGDIRDREKIEDTFKTYKPEIVFHGAALKHVVICDEWPHEAIKTNIFGTMNLIDMAVKYKVKKFIFISSDKSVKPTSVMGQTKKIGEEKCLEANGKTKFIVVRFGNVIGSRGSVIPIWQKQIELEQPLTITDPEMERYFMTAYECCDLLIKAAKMGKGGETYTFDMGKPRKIIDLAKDMIRFSGKDLSYEIIGKGKGEKLNEQLFDGRTERLVKTKYEKIWKITKK